MYEALIDRLIDSGALKTPAIISAFQKVDRRRFVPEQYRENAYDDVPLPIGYGVTISQPRTVALMLELLQPESGQTILDVGFGSGWTTGLLAAIAGSQGRVVATEIIPPIFVRGQEGLLHFRFSNLVLQQAKEGVLGAPEYAPYDRILVSAAAERLPQSLVDQIAPGGIMVIPIQNSVWRIVKDRRGKCHREEFPGFTFVPLRE